MSRRSAPVAPNCDVARWPARSMARRTSAISRVNGCNDTSDRSMPKTPTIRSACSD
jgi:hypothetical protein